MKKKCPTKCIQKSCLYEIKGSEDMLLVEINYSLKVGKSQSPSHISSIHSPNFLFQP